MRVLKPEELKKVQRKIEEICGNSTQLLTSKKRKFVLHDDFVYIIHESLMKIISGIKNDDMRMMGNPIGKFTKSERFRLEPFSLHTLAEYAQNRVIIKRSAEMNVLYGHNVLKSHIFSAPSSLKANDTVVLFNQDEIPLGIGMFTKSFANYEKDTPNCLSVISKCDNGEYLRNESSN